MIRIAIIMLAVIIFLIISLPMLLVEWIIGKFNPSLKAKSSLSIVKIAFRMVLFLSGTTVTVKGLENIPTDRSVLFIGNHRSYFDIILNYIYIPVITGFVSKKEVNRVPVLRLWMRNLKCLFLDRNDIKQGMQTILTAIDYINSGISIFIFPEGTRSKVNDTFLPFKGGSFKIATKSGCDIVPVAINNSAAIFEDHFPKIVKSHVVIEYGKPISTKEMNRDEQRELPDMVRNKIINMYEQNKAAV